MIQEAQLRDSEKASWHYYEMGGVSAGMAITPLKTKMNMWFLARAFTA